jgi:hypothetical protein
MATKYGVISDLHEDPRIIVPTLKILKNEGAEKLLVNGDIGHDQDSTAAIIDYIGRFGLESYVQPGSHESIREFNPVMDYLTDQYSNLVDLTKPENKKLEEKDHHLVFLPGSDFLSNNGEYKIENKLPTGTYYFHNNEIMDINFEQYFQLKSNGIDIKRINYSNMNDLKKQVTHPEKTIVVCHVPRKFDNLETCVDMAEFGEVTENFKIGNNKFSKGNIFPLPVVKSILNQYGDVPIKIKHENRGNKDLKELYEELGITKAVTGHFHESSHRANDSNNNHIPEHTPRNDLFWNSGHLDKGYTGILIVDGENISYQNIKLGE